MVLLELLAVDAALEEQPALLIVNALPDNENALAPDAN
jgi:hypothetical protein